MLNDVNTLLSELTKEECLGDYCENPCNTGNECKKEPTLEEQMREFESDCNMSVRFIDKYNITGNFFHKDLHTQRYYFANEMFYLWQIARGYK